MSTPTTLGKAQAAQAPAESAFALALSGALPYREIEIPRLGIRCRLQLLGHADGQAIEAELWRVMRERELPYNSATLYNWEAERAVLVVSRAAREVAPPHAPIGTLAEWERVPTDIIADVFRTYCDMREELDPVDTPLTAEEWKGIEEAIAKKNSRSLRSYGTRLLSGFMLATADQRATSPTPKFSPMGVSSASWPPLSPDETTQPMEIDEGV